MPRRRGRGGGERPAPGAGFPRLAAVPANPSFDDLADVLAAVIDVGRSARQIRDATGLNWERTQRAVADLASRDIIRSQGGGYYRTRQRRCRRCDELRPDAVAVDPETLAWLCAECWKQDVERTRRLVEA
jgi:hypothetical protein